MNAGPPTPDRDPLTGRRMLYVGTYTPDSEPAGHGAGVHRVWFDPETGELVDGGVAARVSGPSFLALDPGRPWIHAVSERTDGALTVLRVEHDGLLTELGRGPSHGASPCHVLALGAAGAAVSHYADGRVAVLEVGPDGSVPDRPRVLFTHTGHGPVTDRQEGPHAHSALLVTEDSGGATLLVADLGTDELRAHDLAGSTIPGEHGRDAHTAGAHSETVSLPAGTGPRHMALSGDGIHLYVTGELDSRVHVVRRPHDAGPAAYLGSVPATAEGGAGENFPAELAVHGERLYVSNRGADVVSTFALREGGARPEHLADTPVGPWPRHFAVVRGHREEPDHLVAAAQNGGFLTSLRLDAETGVPVDTGHRMDLPDPVCVLPVPLRRIRRGQSPQV